MRGLKLPEWMANVRTQVELCDEFFYYTSTETWTSLAADAGVTAPVQADAEHGRVTMATGATDNNEVAVRSTNEFALFQADYQFIAETSIQFTEANTDDANVAFGLADAAGADLLSDNGAGDNINSSGVLIFKVDGETVWRCACENNGVIRETQSVQTAGGAAFQFLRIIGQAISGLDMEFTYFLDDQPLRDSNNRPIKHTLAFASATEMRLVPAYIKAGGANSETLLLNYTGFVATRV